MKYEIKSSLEKERILVNAKFKKGNKTVHEVNFAFPWDTDSEEIKAEVEKAGELFEQEIEQRKEQKKVDEKFDKAQSTINQLNNSKQ